MSPKSRQHPSVVRRASPTAAAIHDWLERFLSQLTYQALDRVGDVHLFSLTGPDGSGLLAETSAQLPGRPGVYQARLGAWVARATDPVAYLLTAELHSWDAWTDASATGDDHWLKVPRAKMYAERDRRTAAISAELDTLGIAVVPAGAVPELHVALPPDATHALVSRHAQALIQQAEDPSPSTGWPEFVGQLERALAAMPPDTFLILSTGSRRAKRGYYVQFAASAHSLRAEAVGNDYLAAMDRLDLEQLAMLEHLGWDRPDEAQSTSNWSKTWQAPAPHAEVATLAAETLRLVYRVDGRASLRYRYESMNQEPLRDLDLDIPREGRSPRPASPSSSQAYESARARVEGALKEWLEIDSLTVDRDGDWPIRFGSAMYFVRVLDGVPPAVAVFSPILRDITITPPLLEALNEINVRIRYARVFAQHRSVFVALELPALEAAPADIAFACRELGSLADHLDDVLHGQFGGSIAFDSPPRLLH